MDSEEIVPATDTIAVNADPTISVEFTIRPSTALILRVEKSSS